MNEITLQQKIDRLKQLMVNEAVEMAQLPSFIYDAEEFDNYKENARSIYYTYRAMLNDYSPAEAAKFDADFDAEAKKYIEENE